MNLFYIFIIFINVFSYGLGNWNSIYFNNQDSNTNNIFHENKYIIKDGTIVCLYKNNLIKLIINTSDKDKLESNYQVDLTYLDPINGNITLEGFISNKKNILIKNTYNSEESILMFIDDIKNKRISSFLLHNKKLVKKINIF